jgi:hypothetical protein
MYVYTHKHTHTHTHTQTHTHTHTHTHTKVQILTQTALQEPEYHYIPSPLLAYFRCSVYMLYWYKSTNTDADGAATPPPAPHLLSHSTSSFAPPPLSLHLLSLHFHSQPQPHLLSHSTSSLTPSPLSLHLLSRSTSLDLNLQPTRSSFLSALRQVFSYFLRLTTYLIYY